VIHSEFKDPEGHIDRVQIKNITAAAAESICTCAEKGPGMCSHAAAALQHYKSFSHGEPPPGGPDAPPKFAGLKYEGFQELFAKVISSSKAELHINAESEFPHVPSKWERAALSVTLKAGTREYIGNLNNLRQLHFGKSMAAALQAANFSLQERQIIRYLAINAEADNSKLTLDAEQTAEFFHCLAGFPNFYKKGERIVVHKEKAEPVILCVKRGGVFTLRSAVTVDGAMLPLKSDKVITGRCGCWVGAGCEYWWIPAFVDVGWLRSFLRAEEQPCDMKTAETLLSGHLDIPFRVLREDGSGEGDEKCRALFSGEFSEEKGFDLTLSFMYKDKVCPANDGKLVSVEGKFCKRDTGAEQGIIDELKCFGFTRDNDNPSKFTLPDIESTGIFIDKVIPAWEKSGHAFFMSSTMAAMSSGGKGAPEIRLFCRLAASSEHHFTLGYEARAGEDKVSWKDLVKAASLNRGYLTTPGKGVAELGEKLKKFVMSTADIVSEAEQGRLRIPRSAAAFWVSAAALIPEAVPPEFYEFQAMFKNAVTAEEEPPAAEAAADPLFKGELRNYQRRGVTWMKELGVRGFNLVLADEMGLGKTIQAIALLCRHTGKGPSLIICPTSLIENWEREFARFSPRLKLTAVRGPSREKLWEDARESDVVVTSYSLLRRDTVPAEKINFNYVILDEAQHIKNPATSNAKTCKSLKSSKRLVLTGTPLENSPDDLWSIFDFLHPGLLGTLSKFKSSLGSASENEVGLEALAARTAPFILRRKKLDVCAELPPVQEQTFLCDMDDAQRILYSSFLDRARGQCEKMEPGKSGVGFEILTTLLRLRQICCHPGLLPPDLLGADKAAPLPPSAKMDLLQELTLENLDSGHKMLIFSQFTSLLRIIEQWLVSQGILYEYLDGATKNRMERVDNFNNNSSVKIFLLSLKAGGTGLNLTAADTVIIYDPWWNPAVEAQASDRAHRIGQTKPVSKMKLVMKESIEEKILELQAKKQFVFNSLVEKPSAAFSKLDINDIRFLLGMDSHFQTGAARDDGF
jgi:superfamily II DNA or RNA helicase